MMSKLFMDLLPKDRQSPLRFDVIELTIEATPLTKSANIPERASCLLFNYQIILTPRFESRFT